MIKKYIKITAIIVLLLVILFEIGYIVKTNIKGSHSEAVVNSTPTPEPLPIVAGENNDTGVDEAKIIVIDAGHGKPSVHMTDEEKRNAGWVQNSDGEWGEWRHYKSGSSTDNCEAVGCNGRVTPDGDCWYPIGNSDRNTEPEINLKNALAAQKYLEAMGYTVRMTRTSNDENPSITKRLLYCYPDGDASKPPEAEAFICIHSNASGGSGQGTAYISAKEPYDQAWIKTDYADDSNKLGKLCNNYIADMTDLTLHGNGEIAWEPELIAFCKSPVPCGYLEIGFFDNSSDLDIINTEYENIGKAIAKGVDEFCKTH